jgi:hypothetical protein
MRLCTARPLSSGPVPFVVFGFFAGFFFAIVASVYEPVG